MSRHRARPTRRDLAAPRRHAASHPRYGRISALAVSVTVCGVALLGGFGVLPSVADSAVDRAADSGVAKDLTGESDLASVGDKAVLVLDSAKNSAHSSADNPVGDGTQNEPPGASSSGDLADVSASADETLPKDSGDGYRIVFSQARQRVWLVDTDGTVGRTYPVSGSLYDNLEPGSYEVYSRSEQAYAFDGSGSMKYFVRFAQGDTGSAIGFHDIPLDNDDNLVQSVSQLGTPQSHGCVRQKREDAIALWEFAPIGTDVVVTA